MRRRILQIIALLLIGAAITVGVAWTCVALADWRGKWTTPGSDPDAAGTLRWLWTPRDGWPEPTLRWDSFTFGGRDVEVGRSTKVGGLEVRALQHLQRTRRAGWPCPALQTRDEYPPRRAWNPRFITKDVWINSWEQGVGVTGPPGAGQIRLPLAPIWVGFVVNSALYAALVWGLVAGVGAGRRRIRVLRGRCGRCGYPVGTSPVCSECGGALPPAAAECVSDDHGPVAR